MHFSKLYFSELIGKKIIDFDASRDSLRFVDSDKGIHTYTAVGDCCSRSWFEHWDDYGIAEDCTVNSVSEKEYITYKDEYNRIQVYGWTLVTDKGYIDIEMRNSSNGYYGGWVEYDYKAPEKRLINKVNFDTGGLDLDNMVYINDILYVKNNGPFI